MRPFKIFLDKKEHTDAEKEGIEGPVKQVMHILYKAHLKGNKVIQGKIEADRNFNEQNYVLTFNEHGMILIEDLYGADGRHVKVYKHSGEQLTGVKYDNDGSIDESTTYYYNEAGKSLGYTTVGKSKYSYSQAVKEYDEKGNLASYAYYSGKEKELLNRHVYNYDDKGNQILEIEYNRDGEIKKKTTIAYNERGDRIEFKVDIVIPDNYSKSYRVVYTYNEHNDLSEMIYYKADGSYDKTHTHTYEYDSDGNKIIKENVYDPFALEPGQTEKVVNDRYNNWIKKTRLHNQKPINIYVRHITYFDDAEQKELVHPLSEKDVDETIVDDIRNKIPPLHEDEVQWMMHAPGASVENFPALQYYLMRFKEIPSATAYEGPYIEARQLAEALQKEMGAEIIHSSGSAWNNNLEQLEKYTLGFRSYPYLLQAINIEPYSITEFLLPDFIDKHYSNSLFISDLKLLRPGDNSASRDEYFEKELDDYIDKYSLEKKPDKPKINIIQVTGNNFSMKEYPVDDSFEIRDLDINYGYGFEKFHNDLMSRFNNSTKGLVLFHGEPGTGKTYYIRHLLRSMVANKKVVIYMPPNMVDHLVEPVFMTFLTSQIKSWSVAGNFCVLLIEDAEPLLAKRQEGVRIQGITNLLNMSDGLLNDMLNLQIICTFNVGLRKLDSALLRPGRLIARKEFKALSELDANLLAQRIGIKHHFKGPATLGEIYAMRKNQNILIHETDPDENSSTHIDDLI